MKTKYAPHVVKDKRFPVGYAIILLDRLPATPPATPTELDGIIIAFEPFLVVPADEQHPGCVHGDMAMVHPYFVETWAQLVSLQ